MCLTEYFTKRKFYSFGPFKFRAEKNKTCLLLITGEVINILKYLSETAS